MKDEIKPTHEHRGIPVAAPSNTQKLAALLKAPPDLLPRAMAQTAALALLERQHEILSALRGKVVANA